jgi:hypothetical protein
MVDLTNENSDSTDLVTQLMVIQPKKIELLPDFGGLLGECFWGVRLKIG